MDEVLNKLTYIQYVSINKEFLQKVYNNELTSIEKEKYKKEIARYKYLIRQ